MKFLRLFKFKLALTFMVLVSCKTTNQNEIKELKPLITNIYTADKVTIKCYLKVIKNRIVYMII